VIKSSVFLLFVVRLSQNRGADGEVTPAANRLRWLQLSYPTRD